MVWLKRHNPLYADIDIDTAELHSWDTPSHGVASQVSERLERDEPSRRRGRRRTAQVVPPTKRGLEDEGSVLCRYSRSAGSAGPGVRCRYRGDEAGKPVDAHLKPVMRTSTALPPVLARSTRSARPGCSPSMGDRISRTWRSCAMSTKLCAMMTPVTKCGPGRGGIGRGAASGHARTLYPRV